MSQLKNKPSLFDFKRANSSTSSKWLGESFMSRMSGFSRVSFMSGNPSDADNDKNGKTMKKLVIETKRRGTNLQNIIGKGFSDVIKDDKKKWSPLRTFINNVVDSKLFGSLILTVIMINTILIAVELDSQTSMRNGWSLNLLDEIFMGIYIFELLMKLFALRWEFFKNGFNLFDMLIVSEVLFQSISKAVNPKVFRLLRVFRAIRALRALRALRAISFLKNLQSIVATLLKSIPAMTNITMLVALVLYIFAIIGVNLFRDSFPQRFGHIPIAFFSLIQMITLDNWSDFYTRYPGSYDYETQIGYNYNATVKPLQTQMQLFGQVFIIVESFILINLFVAVIINNLQNQAKKKVYKKKGPREVVDNHANTLMPMNDFKLEKSRSVGWENEHQALEEVGKQKDIGSEDMDLHYKEFNLPTWEKHIMADFLMALAAIDSNMESYQRTQQTLDDLVDLTLEDIENDDSDLI